ncbi:unnamed protein product, partial [Vitis vinifera]|uniref:Uncharacterized protein n=1 Tax=Vitis vinifera TaxID=29760 RepID=D7TGC6_VITVI
MLNIISDLLFTRGSPKALGLASLIETFSLEAPLFVLPMLLPLEASSSSMQPVVSISEGPLSASVEEILFA